MDGGDDGVGRTAGNPLGDAHATAILECLARLNTNNALPRAAITPHLDRTR